MPLKNQTGPVEAKMIAILPLNYNKYEYKNINLFFVNKCKCTSCKPYNSIRIEKKKTFMKYHADYSFFLYNSECSRISFHSNIVFKVH